MPNDQPQVPESHYRKPSYLFKERWNSYWHQINRVRATQPKNVLEIGLGNGIVRDVLTLIGFQVATVDIDPALKPTHLASITNLPLDVDSFDTVLCAEVLEHLPWEDSQKAMQEIFRVTKKYAIVTVPHSGYVFSFLGKIPLLPWLKMGFKIPHFWKTHHFNGQHYWECGKRNWPKKKIKQALEHVGFRIKSVTIEPDDPSHLVYVCAKNP